MSDPLFKNKKERYSKHRLERDDVVFEGDGSYWTNHGDPPYSLYMGDISYTKEYGPQDFAWKVLQYLEQVFLMKEVQEWLNVTDHKYFTYVNFDGDDEGRISVRQYFTHELCGMCNQDDVKCHPLYRNVQEDEREFKTNYRIQIKVEILERK